MNELLSAVLGAGLVILVVWLAARLFFFVLGVKIQSDRKRRTSASTNTLDKRTGKSSIRHQELRAVNQARLGALMAILAPHFSFQGAASRKQFILTQLVTGAVLGFFLGIGILMYASWSNLVQMLGILLILASFCVGSWLLWAVSAKRVRDTGVTVWWVLSLLVPPLNLATLVFMLLVPTNEFEGRGL